MKIYTKTGDKGQTSLANGQRVSKSDARLQAYGTVDELNSFVGLLRCKLSDNTEVDHDLEWVQNKLFNLGAALAQAQGEWIMENDVEILEKWMDEMQKELPTFQGFVLPGGSETVSLCHVCRTITRRLEREMVYLNGTPVGKENGSVLVCFVNRLSDFWFVLAQKCAKSEGVSVNFWKK